jgi:hypothetical protein
VDGKSSKSGVMFAVVSRRTDMRFLSPIRIRCVDVFSFISEKLVQIRKYFGTSMHEQLLSAADSDICLQEGAYKS